MNRGTEKLFTNKEDQTGIYSITNIIDNKIYIGYAVHFNQRWYGHKGKLKRGKHGNTHLQRAWNKYGEQMFKFERVELCTEDQLCKREHYWCCLLNTHNSDIGYNDKPTGINKSVHQSEKAKEKIKKARASQVITEDHKNNISNGLKGHKRTKEEYWKAYATKIKNGAIKAVIQMDMNGNFIKEWESNAIAADTLGISRGTISSICNNKPHCISAKGFKFKFKPVSKN